VGKGFAQIVFSQICVSVNLKEMETRVNCKDPFYDRKSDQMISSQKDGKFVFGEDLTQSVPNQAQRDLLLSQR
jgi:hypothetical protein